MSPQSTKISNNNSYEYEPSCNHHICQIIKEQYGHTQKYVSAVLYSHYNYNPVFYVGCTARNNSIEQYDICTSSEKYNCISTCFIEQVRETVCTSSGMIIENSIFLDKKSNYRWFVADDTVVFIGKLFKSKGANYSRATQIINNRINFMRSVRNTNTLHSHANFLESNLSCYLMNKTPYYPSITPRAAEIMQYCMDLFIL